MCCVDQQNGRRVIVLGGGITGLTCGFILGAPVITSSVGGQLSLGFTPGPRYLHDTPENRWLLDELKIRYRPRKIVVEYFYRGKYHKTVPEELVWEYILKTRGELAPISMHQKEFTALTASMEEVVKKLVKKVRVIIDDIVKIEPGALIGQHRKYKYDFLVSTIPAPEFFRLWGIPCVLRYRPIGYYFSPPDVSFFFAATFGRRDYVYFPELHIPYYRVTRVSGGFVYEYPEIAADKAPEGTVWQKYGKILPPFGAQPPAENVFFVGRYAEWNDELLLHDVIRKCRELKNQL